MDSEGPCLVEKIMINLLNMGDSIHFISKNCAGYGPRV